MDRYELLKLSPAVQERIERILRLSRIDLLLLFVIVYLMVTKPGV